MKIAQVAPVWERVPPVKYGGIELVVYLLSEELVRRGHEVTLYASGNSVTSGHLVSVYPEEQRAVIGNPCPDLLHVTNAFMGADKFDVIHNHAGYSGISMSNLVSTPVLTTLHGIFTEVNKPLFKAFKNSCYYNSISDEQRKGFPDLNYVGTVYNAIDISTFPFSETKEDYFFLISRVSPLKGTHLAVEIARKAGVKLILAGKIDPGADMAYFEKEVKPYVDGKQIMFLEEVTEEKKRELLKNARGFLFPLQWAEPFGLVMIEAMVCGTPVIGFPYGAVPEVVVHKETGFLAKNVEEMVDFVKRVDEIDPHKCRQHVEEKFSVKRMVDDYEALYGEVLKRGKVTHLNVTS